MTYLDRYMQGEHQQVWAELMELGPIVRDKALFYDAYGVAVETMRRVRHNVETLILRLNGIGYKFMSLEPNAPFYQGPFVPPAADAALRIQQLEARYGLLPLSLRAALEIIGHVDFCGSHPEWDVAGQDPLYLDGVDDLDIHPQIYLPLELQTGAPPAISANQNPILYDVTFSPDVFFKEGHAGGSNYFVTIPNPSADAVFGAEFSDRYIPNMTFVKYLRISIDWGGFPGFLRTYRFTMPEKHKRILTEGLVPF